MQPEESPTSAEETNDRDSCEARKWQKSAAYEKVAVIAANVVFFTSSSRIETKK